MAGFDVLRKARVASVPSIAGLLLGGRALGGTALRGRELGPWPAANNPADPSLRLLGAILMIFAASLCMLAVGYITDTTRLGDGAGPAPRA
ncbi:hypothetical protein OJF2_03260 [Aquisphaera giovannonii]|uniref:Uncharacterized protein n=1 Tax=Aquisphaera giovannonii TaxID=406548 RepID=A0A5B9VUS6_9BACT|nr:hypothetical protein [Aquisphaera giovannonii]QEH31859.1 hypothetical protein OJF2_03260 [Aquisphaera giovannonii]